jgi:uncharacterized protein (TIGR03086 family)
MKNVRDLFDHGVQRFSTYVQTIGPDDWDKPTPNRDWNVSALVEHLIDEHRWMPPLIDGHDLSTAQTMVAGLASASTGDHAGDWADASLASLQAVGEPGALERTVQLSRGPTPAQEYVVEMVFDLAVHSWDLGKALGKDEQVPDELATFLYPIIMGMGDLSGTGMFDPPVSVPDHAPVCDKLIAATGRNPY